MTSVGLGGSNEGFEECMYRIGVGSEISENGVRFASFLFGK